MTALRGDGGSLAPESCHTHASMPPLTGVRLTGPAAPYTQSLVPGSMYQYDQYVSLSTAAHPVPGAPSSAQTKPPP